MSFIDDYLEQVKLVAELTSRDQIEKMIDNIIQVRSRGGRIFFLGVGGGAGNASHAVNDFRKICDIEAYSPCDNSSELTARINDDGWESAFVEWLKASRLNSQDAVFVFSVGGGNQEKKVSINLVKALDFARERKAMIMGVVGRDGGYTARVADSCVIIPTINPETITPHTESFQGVIWHLIVTHPEVRRNEMKWESIK